VTKVAGHKALSAPRPDHGYGRSVFWPGLDCSLIGHGNRSGIDPCQKLKRFQFCLEPSEQRRCFVSRLSILPKRRPVLSNADAPRLNTVPNLGLLSSFGKDLNVFGRTIILILDIDKIDQLFDCVW